MNVLDTAPSFGSGSVSNKTYIAGQAITDFTVPAASGGNGAITYAAANLPDGLVFDATGTDTPGCTGTEAREICGTPTTAGAAQTVTITADDADANMASGDQGTLTFTIAVDADTAPSFGMGSVTNRTYVASSAIAEFTVPAASGGNGTIVYTASGLPTGLVFDATGSDTPGCTGTEAREICGTPTVIGGPATVTIAARDSDSNLGAGDRATLTFTITVSSDAPPSFGSGSVPEKAFFTNTAIADFQVPAASGGNGTITYAAAGLPTGLVFDATGTDTPGCTGSEAREICGTPTVAGTGAVTITAQDGDTNMGVGDRATLSFAYSVAADTAPTFGMASVTAKTFPAGAAITEFTIPAASGGNGTLTYAAANLPSGLVFDATGMDSPGCPGTEAREVCGTPDAATSGAVTVTATDLDANTAPTDRAALTFTVTVTAGASLASSPSPLAEANLHGAELAVTLIGVTYASGVSASSFQLATAPTIAGLSIASVTGGAAGTTTATLTLATGAGYDVDAAATLSVTVLAAAHSGAGDVATGSLPVTPTAPAVVVSRTSLSLDEDPGADDANEGTYTLVLDTRPTGCTAGVGVSVASGNPDVTPEPTTLTFTPDDWNAPQTVTVTAEQDDDGADDRATLRHSISTACAAAGYPETLAIPSVEVAVNDDDAPPPAGDVPTEVRAEATATGLLVTWTAAAGATSYKVQWRLAGQEWSSSRQEETTATRIELDGLAAGSYEVRVVAVADGQDGAASAAAAGEVSEPVNAAPRLAEELPDLQLDVGETRTVDLDAAFEDPNGDRLRYSASSDGAAVSVRATSGGLRVRGVRPGEATVTVTATDPEGLGATATFDVSVGALLSLSGDAAAPEGGRIVLTATLGRPLAEPLAVSWRIAPDDDPATPDADASDYDSAGATTIPAGETAADIEIAVVDDADIEPARERFVVALNEPETPNVGLSRSARATATIQEGVCDRTPAVRDELARGWRDCHWPRPADLARIATLDLNARGIAALRGNDLLGLAGLERLDLSANALEALPPGLFAGLRHLREVSVEDNPGAPFGLAVTLARTDAEPWAPGPATITARAALGAPFPLTAMLTASPTPAAETASRPPWQSPPARRLAQRSPRRSPPDRPWPSAPTPRQCRRRSAAEPLLPRLRDHAGFPPDPLPPPAAAAGGARPGTARRRRPPAPPAVLAGRPRRCPGRHGLGSVLVGRLHRDGAHRRRRPAGTAGTGQRRLGADRPRRHRRPRP